MELMACIEALRWISTGAPWENVKTFCRCHEDCIGSGPKHGVHFAHDKTLMQHSRTFLLYLLNRFEKIRYISGEPKNGNGTLFHEENRLTDLALASAVLS